MGRYLNFKFLVFLLLGGLLSAESPVVLNEDHVFDHIAPCFFMEGAKGKKIHWQISEDESFTNVIPQYDALENFNDLVLIDQDKDHFLQSDQTYFFRARILIGDNWSEWSLPFFFFIKKDLSIPKAYPVNPFVKDWERLKKYFLPETHPIKEVLDDIFSKSRVTLDLKTMKKAGFINPVPRRYTRLIVTKHPRLKGFVVKAYLDAQKNRKNEPDQYFWVKRIKGVKAIKHVIKQKGWTDRYKVPKKYIYPLPLEPAPPKEFQRVNFILVEEDMDIYDDKTNRQMWKGSAITKQKLQEIYIILRSVGLHDGAKPDNIPFSKDGKIAFIDTQSYHEWPVNYKKLIPYLSKPMREYWKKLTKN